MKICRYCGMELPSPDAFHDIQSCAEFLKARAEKAEAKLAKAGDDVMEIITQVLSGENVHYLSSNANGRKYIRWGTVEKDIRALFEKGGEK